jgi:hypothetical protein
VSHDQNERRDLRVQASMAGIAGAFTGLTRAVVDWLLRQLTS